MSTAQVYRKLAESQRRLAELSDFPLMRGRYLASAERWERLAQQKSLAEMPTGEARGQEYSS
jgi:hypothetical protein